jgi:hypothetical protein
LQPVDLVSTGFVVSVHGPQEVQFRGMVNHDKAGMAGGAMIYPAFGVVGFLAAIATHGVLVESSRSSEKSRLQLEADRVLEPYSKVLAGLTNHQLYSRVVAAMDLKQVSISTPAADITPAGWVVQSTPLFVLSQDRRALVLENAVVVFEARKPAEPVFRNIVRVVSRSRVLEPDIDTSRLAVIASAASAASVPGAVPEPGVAPNGDALAASDVAPVVADDPAEVEQLVLDSVDLLARSVRIVLDELAAGGLPREAKARTFRYPEGREEKIERGQLVRHQCDRMVIQTLRGWLMSVPVQSTDTDSSAAQCAAAGVN